MAFEKRDSGEAGLLIKLKNFRLHLQAEASDLSISGDPTIAFHAAMRTRIHHVESTTTRRGPHHLLVCRQPARLRD